MTKIKILNSGMIKTIGDETPCCDTSHNLMRIGDTKVGDMVLVTNEDQTKDEVAEILEKPASTSSPRGQ